MKALLHYPFYKANSFSRIAKKLIFQSGLDLAQSCKVMTANPYPIRTTLLVNLDRSEGLASTNAIYNRIS